MVSFRKCHALFSFLSSGFKTSSSYSDDYSGTTHLGAGSLEGTGMGGVLAGVLKGVWKGVFQTVFFFVVGLSTVSFGSGKTGD